MKYVILKKINFSALNMLSIEKAFLCKMYNVRDGISEVLDIATSLGDFNVRYCKA